MTPYDFAAKWRGNALKELATAYEAARVEVIEQRVREAAAEKERVARQRRDQGGAD